MATLARENFDYIVASQEEEARKAVLKEAKNAYQENKDDISELTFVIDSMTTERTDIESKKANTTSNRQIANYETQIADLTKAITDATTARTALQAMVSAYESQKLQEENSFVTDAIALKATKAANLASKYTYFETVRG